MYSLEPLRIGSTYQFRILPNSREIIDFRQLKTTRSEATK
jgi:hypothetical protein